MIGHFVEVTLAQFADFEVGYFKYLRRCAVVEDTFGCACASQG